MKLLMDVDEYGYHLFIFKVAGVHFLPQLMSIFHLQVNYKNWHITLINY